MGKSTIEWTTDTWNPVTGCDRVSPGCAHCYALTLAGRLKAMGQAKYQRDGDPKTSGPGFGVTLHPDTLEEPLRWRKPRMVFVNSMSDLFHEGIPDEYIARVFQTMAACPQHVFQILTKRPERMRDWIRDHMWCSVCWGEDPDCEGTCRDGIYVLPNAWLGVSIENRRFVHRADVLADTPAAVRFISAEPLLGPLIPETITVDGLTGQTTYEWQDDYTGPGLTFYNRDGDLAFDWLITGGESGPNHRPIDPEWVRDLRDVCVHEGVAFFHKQNGGVRPKSGGRELDGREWNEMPQ